MDAIDGLAGLFQENQKILLWIAISLAVGFICLLVFDVVKNRRRDNRFAARPGGIWRTLKQPFRNVAALVAAFKELRRQRAQRRSWDTPRHRHRPARRGRQDKRPSV